MTSQDVIFGAVDILSTSSDSYQSSHPFPIYFFAPTIDKDQLFIIHRNTKKRQNIQHILTFSVISFIIGISFLTISCLYYFVE